MGIDRDWHKELAKKIEDRKKTPIPPMPTPARISRQEFIDGLDDGARDDDSCPEIDYFGNEV